MTTYTELYLEIDAYRYLLTAVVIDTKQRYFPFRFHGYNIMSLFIIVMLTEKQHLLGVDKLAKRILTTLLIGTIIGKEGYATDTSRPSESHGKVSRPIEHRQGIDGTPPDRYPTARAVFIEAEARASMDRLLDPWRFVCQLDAPFRWTALRNRWFRSVSVSRISSSSALVRLTDTMHLSTRTVSRSGTWDVINLVIRATSCVTK